MVRAASNYKQVKIVLTEQRDVTHPGRVAVSVRVHVKPLEAQWHEKQLVLSTVELDLDPLSDLTAVYAAIFTVLGAPPLPGHIG